MASLKSQVWLKNGGWFKKSASVDNADEVVCVFEDEDGSACGRTMNLHISNMWKHLADVHKFTKDDAQRRLAEQNKGGMRAYTKTLKRQALSEEQQEEYTVLLAVALANQGISLFAFDKRAERHMAIINDDGESAYDTFQRFTLNSFVLHILPEFHNVTGKTLQQRLAAENLLLAQDVRFVIKLMIGIGLTTDGYSGDQKLKFHSLTCHGPVRLGGRLCFVNFVLAADTFPEGEAQTVGSWIVAKCNEWGIKTEATGPGCQLVGASVDGAERKALECAGIPFVWCFAHALDLAISDVTEMSAMDDSPPYLYTPVPDVIQRAKASVTTYFAYPKRLAALNELAEQEFQLKERSFFQEWWRLAGVASF
jgi:hypothetical protein